MAGDITSGCALAGLAGRGFLLRQPSDAVNFPVIHHSYGAHRARKILIKFQLEIISCPYSIMLCVPVRRRTHGVTGTVHPIVAGTAPEGGQSPLRPAVDAARLGARHDRGAHRTLHRQRPTTAALLS